MAAARVRARILLPLLSIAARSDGHAHYADTASRQGEVAHDHEERRGGRPANLAHRHHCGTHSGHNWDARGARSHPGASRQHIMPADDCSPTFNNPKARSVLPEPCTWWRTGTPRAAPATHARHETSRAHPTRLRQEAYSPAVGATYEINVSVHVVYDPAVPGSKLAEGCVLQGIDWLNRDFRAEPGTKVAASTDTRIQFALHGQVHYIESAEYFSALRFGDLEAKMYDEGGRRYDPEDGLNIWIKKPVTRDCEGCDVLGWATYPWESAGLQGDGVVVNYQAWGDCASRDGFDDGGTVAHEVGHYLGLFHTFEDGGAVEGDVAYSYNCGAATWPACAQTGDLVCDTPPQQDPLNVGHDGCDDSDRSCNSVPPVHNFMSYSCALAARPLRV